MGDRAAAIRVRQGRPGGAGNRVMQRMPDHGAAPVPDRNRYWRPAEERRTVAVACILSDIHLSSPSFGYRTGPLGRSVMRSHGGPLSWARHFSRVRSGTDRRSDTASGRRYRSSLGRSIFAPDHASQDRHPLCLGQLIEGLHNIGGSRGADVDAAQ